MDVKRNKRFLGQNDTLWLVSGGMLIFGLLWFWLGWSAASYYGPCVMVSVGFVLFLVASGRHVPESEIRTVIQRHSALAEPIKNNSSYKKGKNKKYVNKCKYYSKYGKNIQRKAESNEKQSRAKKFFAFFWWRKTKANFVQNVYFLFVSKSCASNYEAKRG